MGIIKPFRGYRYNAEKIDNIASVLAPPYDAIDEEKRMELYTRSENNIVRVIRGMKYENDTEKNNAYTRANQYLQDWIESGVLKREEKPAIYLYEQSTEINEVRYSNKGFVCLLKIDGGNIMPCEESIKDNREDRFNLIAASHANISMINCMYVEREKMLLNIMSELAEETPDMEFTTADGVSQRVWAITYEPTIRFIADNLVDKNIYIADGQNRYDAAKKYRDVCRANNPNHTGEEDYNYVMALMQNAADDGMRLLPMHRLIRFPKGFKEDFFVAASQDHFKIEKIIVDTTDEEMRDTMRVQIATPRKEFKCALYCGKKYFYRLTLTDKDYLTQLFPDKSPAYRMLDVTVLNSLILEDIFNIMPDKMDERVDYTISRTEGIKKVDAGEYGCMVVINAVKSAQISEVSQAGEKMPKRSIFIFPKASSGVVLNIMDDNLIIKSEE